MYPISMLLRRRYSLCVSAVVLLLILCTTPVGAATATGVVTLADTEPAEALPAVMVSDGLTIVRTDAQGRYELELADDARFIMVVNPPGTEPQRDFYRQLPEERAEPVVCDFVLRRSERSLEAPLRFIQISDSHASSALRIAEPLINQINSLSDRPVFVMETGDLCSDSLDETVPMESYGQNLLMPYFPVTGNHDASRARGSSFAGAEFERVFGPWYYAWSSGRYLFVGLPWSPREGSLTEAARWLEYLLTMNAEVEQSHVVVGFHHWDGLGAWGSAQLERFLGLFREFDVRAALMGHWHLARVHEAYGIPIYVTRNPVMGNRDLAAGGFLLFTAEPDGKLTAEFRTAGYNKHVAVVSPQAGATIPRGRQPLAVNAYDTSSRVQSVEIACYNAESGALLQEIPLQGSGGWTWLGHIAPDDDWPRQVRIEVRAIDEDAREWPAVELSFEVGADLLPVLAPGSDWPMLQQNPARTGVSPDTVGPPFHLAWAHATGAMFGINSPIIVEGVLYVSVENNTEPLAPMPAAIALDATTGERLWTCSMTGRTARGTLAGGDGAICGLADDGVVFALDPKDGRLIWEQDSLVPEPPWRELFSGSPVLFNGMVIAGTGHGLAAYDIRSGTPRWQHSVVPTGGRRWTPDPSPTVAGDRILLAWTSVHALAGNDGAAQWESSERGAITFTPTVAAGRVITVLPDSEERTRYYLQALDAATGEQLWKVPLTTRQRGIYTSPVATDEHVYAFDDRDLYAVELVTGEVAWKMRLPDAAPITGASALSGDHLVYAHSDGMLNAVNVVTQQVDWSFNLGTRVDSAPAMSGNGLYVTGRDGTVYGFVGAR